MDELPEEIRAEIGRLRIQGATIDRIVEHLRTLHGAAVSRSAMGRHVQKLDRIGERLKRSRAVAEALVRELGEQPESRTARLNIELMHNVILDLHMKAAEGEDVDEGGAAALAGNPEGAMMLAKALDHLTKASKADAEFVAKVEARATERAKKAAAAAAEAIGREKGLTRETTEAIKASIFGVTVPAVQRGAAP